MPLLESDDQTTAAAATGRDRWFTQRSLVLGFLGIHTVFLLALLPTIVGGEVLGDLPLYREWAQLGLQFGVWQGIDVPWVYPIGAIAPITIAGLAGPYLYQLVWFLMTASLNALAVSVLTDRGRRRAGYPAAWLWLLLTVLISPVGLLRLEGITAPLVVVALTVVARRPVVAAVLLTVATWIKVWPAAVVLAVVLTARRRLSVVIAGAALSGLVAGAVVLAGGARLLTGFITVQSSRALQLEAPITTPWVWAAASGHSRTVIYENLEIATREVVGPGAGFVAAAMNPIMFAVIVGTAVLIAVAVARERETSRLLLVGSLALVTAFVVFNKVGSPQYLLWIVPIVVVGAFTNWRAWRATIGLTVVIAALTSLVFPVFYLPLADGDPFAVALLTARNALLVVLWAHSVMSLWRITGAPVRRPIAGTATAPVALFGRQGSAS